MKINGLSFSSINVVASGVKTSVVSAEPQLIAASTKGSFAITPAVSKALGLQPGDYIMFANNAQDVEAGVANRVDAVVEFANQNGFDLDTPEGVAACVAAGTTWFIAKGVAQFKKDGTPVMVSVRMSKEEKEKFYDENVDALIANNREKLIAQYELPADASDEDIKAHFTVDDMPAPQTQGFAGCKLAANGSQTGVGLKLSFSDTNNWEQLKYNLDDKTAVKRVYDVDIKNPIADVDYNNGKETVKVTFYALGDYKDEAPSRFGGKKDAE
uniref:Uncharacterized protein n=1 Tax=Geladintestivirus 3 TaxID=3233135 RepID=A0AAU8MIU9_9CAUD